MYTASPEFPGLFWGNRPQRLSLAAAATAAFVMLADNGEKGSVAYPIWKPLVMLSCTSGEVAD